MFGVGLRGGGEEEGVKKVNEINMARRRVGERRGGEGRWVKRG